MTTHDFYRPVHKGLRLALGRLQTRLGDLDPDDKIETTGVLTELEDFLDLAEIHLIDEEMVIHPALEARSPGSTRVIAGDHDEHRLHFGALRALIAEVAQADEIGRRPAVHRLYLQFSSFMADDLKHMHYEETVTLPLLQTLFSNTDLVAMEGEIVALVPPDKLIGFMQIMLPAMDPSERIGFVSGLHANAPKELFHDIVERAAKPALGEEEWARMSRLLAA